MRAVRAEFFNFHSEFGTESTRRSARRLSESSRKVSPRVQPLGSLATAMPSVGMRRTTRVFGVVKGVDGARVLRSGRRLWPDSGEIKLRRHGDGDDWFKIGKGDGGLGYDPDAWAHNATSKPKKIPAVADVGPPKLKDSSCDVVDSACGEHQPDRKYGLVYIRKRKGLAARGDTVDGSVPKRYGRRFVRRQKRKLNSGVSFQVADNSDPQPSEVVSFVFGSSMGRNLYSVRVLCLLFVYLTRARLRLTDLFAFLLSEPISRVNSSCGINIFLDHPSIKRFASCKLFGAVESVPLFSVDFPAIPLCFMHMHSIMFFRYKHQPSLVEINEVEEVIYDDEDGLLFSLKKVALECCTMKSCEANHIENRLASNLSKSSKSACRSAQYRNCLMSRGIQKRRSSLRRRKARNISLVGMQKLNGTLVSDLVSFRKNPVSISVASNNKIRRSLRSTSVRNLKEVSSTMLGSTQGTDPTSCCANILVIESEKCYREGGFNVVLESSSLGEWFIAVKKDGSTKFTHKAEKFMRPCSSNRFTHDIMWTVDDGCKLEFPNRKDWLIFKDLYKECSDRNMLVLGVKVIPIPGVNEVSQDAGNHCALFRRPDSYIAVKDDELCRAMSRKTANYDMDSEDDEWLKKLNEEFFSESEPHEPVSNDNFELIIDAFEKAFYCSPCNITDEKLPTDLCPDLGSSKVTEAIHGYWMKKRKQKRKSSLLRVFQNHQVRRSSFIPKPSIRKKRSFNRQPSQVGRGKQPSFLQAMAAEKDTAEEQKAMHKAEEANASANRSVELAVQRRRRAQLLMNNADLATYRAAMALRIAEVALVCESSDAASAHLLLD